MSLASVDLFVSLGGEEETVSACYFYSGIQEHAM